MSSTTAAPVGGVVPMTRRVMNLAHIATQNARRLPAHPAFIWGEKTLDWAEIDAQVAALAAGLQARGIGNGIIAIVAGQFNAHEAVYGILAAAQQRGQIKYGKG